MTYAVLSLIFLALSLFALGGALLRIRTSRSVIARWAIPVVLSGLVLIVLTSVFDNLMIAAGFMSYRADKISGVRIGAVPLEDFAYPIAALIVLPSLWVLFGRGRRNDR
jgi:lycopene cyclase domain-containing protein